MSSKNSEMERSGQLPEGEKLLAKDAAASLNGPPPDPNALRGRFTLWLCVSVMAAAGFGSSFIFGYNIGSINTPGDEIKLWIANESYPFLHNGVTLNKKNTEDAKKLDEIWSWTVGVFALGGIFGGLLCGLVADKFGRKGAMLLNNVFCIAGGLIMAFSKLANAYPMLILGRLIIGFNCGLNSGLAPMYLTEIAPANLRGMLGSVNQLAVTFSILVANILGHYQVLGTATLWPVVLAFTMVPAVFQLAVLPMCPESPKYLLVVKRNRAGAEQALKKLRQKVDVSVELKVMQDEADKIANAPRVRFGDMFKNPILRWALIIAVMMMLAQQFSGINAAMYFSNDIFGKAGLSPAQSSGATIGMCIINVLMTVVSTWAVERAGRRLLMLSGMAGMWVCSVLIVICLLLVAQSPFPPPTEAPGNWTTTTIEPPNNPYEFAKYMVIVFIFLFVVAFATGPGSIPWFYVSELFDQGARGNANAVAVMTNWLANFIVGMSFLPFALAVGPYAFLLFTVCLTLLWIFTFFFVPETKGRQLAEIEEELKRKAPGYRRT